MVCMRMSSLLQHPFCGMTTRHFSNLEIILDIEFTMCWSVCAGVVYVYMSSLLKGIHHFGLQLCLRQAQPYLSQITL